MIVDYYISKMDYYKFISNSVQQMKKLRDSSAEFGPWNFHNEHHLEEDDKIITKKLKPVAQNKFSLPKMITKNRITYNNSSLSSKQQLQLSDKKKQPKGCDQLLTEALRTKEHAFNPQNISQVRKVQPKSFTKAQRKRKADYEELYLSHRLDIPQFQNREIGNITRFRLLDRLSPQEQQQQNPISHYRVPSSFSISKSNNEQFAKKRSLIDLVKFMKKQSSKYQNENHPTIHKHSRFQSLNEQQYQIQRISDISGRNQLIPTRRYSPVLENVIKCGILRKNLPNFQCKKNKQLARK